MESNNPARSSSYSKLNDWNQSKQPPLVARRSKLPLWKRVFVGLVIVCCVVFIGLGIGFGLKKIHEKCLPVTKQFTQIYKEAAVSTQTPKCSIVGKDILMKNGSAVDAAIATMLCEGVYSPQSAGLGGGFFMMVYTKATHEVEVVDARETAPAKATADLYKEPNSTVYGGLAVAVPGELRGYGLAHSKYGALNWSLLFQPAIKMCTEGIEISPRVSYSLNDGYVHQIKNSSSLRPLFIKDTGEMMKTGDVYYCPELAKTLEIIAEKGADELYTGELSKDLLRDLESFGSLITPEDLKNYQAVIRKPVIFNLSEGVEVQAMPPPGGGLVLGLLMQILDQISFNVTYGLEDIDDLLWAHYFVEACKYAYAKRAEIGDPDFENMTELIQSMITPDLAKRIKNSIQIDETFGPTHYEAMFVPKYDSGTAHVSVLAPNGDAVSITSTLNTGFGAMIRSLSTGIILNNEMDDFSLPSRPNTYGLTPSAANYIKPGKRPSSTMTPAFVFDVDKELTYVLGATGGSRIVSAEAYVYMMHQYRNHSIEDAVLAKRLHHQLMPNEVEFEEGFDEVILEGLHGRGHDLQVAKNKTLSAVYIISRDSAGKITAGADSRKDSIPSGF